MMIDINNLIDKGFVKRAKEICFKEKSKAILNQDGINSVGACILGINENSTYDFFGGHNIVLATGKGYHAEEIALLKCLNENFIPKVVFVTSKSESNENAIALCGHCRQNLLDSIRKEDDVLVVVLTPSGRIKLSITIKESTAHIRSWSKLEINRLLTKDPTCVSCNEKLFNCECEAGKHIYGDQHDDDCPEYCPRYEEVNGKYIKLTIEQTENKLRGK